MTINKAISFVLISKKVFYFTDIYQLMDFIHSFHIIEQLTHNSKMNNVFICENIK